MVSGRAVSRALWKAQKKEVKKTIEAPDPEDTGTSLESDLPTVEEAEKRVEETKGTGEQKVAMLTKPSQLIVNPKTGVYTEVTYDEKTGGVIYTDFTREDYERQRGISKKGGEFISEQQKESKAREEKTQFYQRMEQGKGTPEQLKEYAEAKKLATLEEREAVVDKMMAEAAKIPYEDQPRAGSKLQTAGFVTSGLMGSVSQGAAIGAIAGGSAGLGIGAIPGAIIGTAIATGGALLANQGKNRAIDVANAAENYIQAQKQIKIIMAESVRPGADQQRINDKYFAYKQVIYASEEALFSRSKVDVFFRANEGVTALDDIERWKRLIEPDLDRQIKMNFLNPDEESYKAQMIAAAADFEGKQ